MGFKTPYYASERKFKSDMIPKDLIEKIVEAGTYAASGMNRQPGLIVAVTNKELRDRLSKMNADIMGVNSDPFYGAPVVLIVLADKSAPTYLYDGSLVMGNLMLAAHELGIGSCWIHRAKEEFESEEGKEIVISTDENYLEKGIEFLLKICNKKAILIFCPSFQVFYKHCFRNFFYSKP